MIDHDTQPLAAAEALSCAARTSHYEAPQPDLVVVALVV